MFLTIIAATNSEFAAPIAQGGAPDIPWLRIVFVLILCIGLAIAAIGFVRLRHGMPFLPDRIAGPIKAKRSERGDTQELAIVERLSAGPATQFVVLARGKQRYLLHVSQQAVTEIDRFCAEDEETET